MMDDSRDPRFSIEDSAEAENEPNAKQEQPEENPLPVNFYRPTPGQSEYSYLFNEQEEIDPYDYVMEKVKGKRQAEHTEQADVPQPEKKPERAPERRPAEPRQTVERDLSLDEPANNEKKSLKESLGDLLRRVTNTARIRNEFVRGEHDKSTAERSGAPQEDVERRVDELIRDAENEASGQPEQEPEQPVVPDEETPQTDEPEDTAGADAASVEQQDIPEEEPEKEEPSAETEQSVETDAPPEAEEETVIQDELSEEEQPEPQEPEEAEPEEDEAAEEPAEENLIQAQEETPEEQPAEVTEEEADGEEMTDLFAAAEQNEQQNAEETKASDEAAADMQEELPPMQQVEVLSVSDPIDQPEQTPVSDEAAPQAEQEKRKALCVELDAARLFTEEVLPEVRLDGADGADYSELRMEYAALTGRKSKTEISEKAPAGLQRWLPFLNVRKQKSAGAPHNEAEKARSAESVHQKPNREPDPDTTPTAESKRKGQAKREPAAKPEESAKSDEPDAPHSAVDPAKALRKRLSAESKRVFFTLLAVGAIGVFLAAAAVCARFGVPLAPWLSPADQSRTFALINLGGVGISMVLCRSVIGVGLLSFFRGQKSVGADGAFSVASIACAVQALVAVIRPDALASGAVWLYAPIGVLGLCGNQLGKLCMLRRTRENYTELCTAPERLVLARLEEEGRVQRIIDADVPGRLTVGTVEAPDMADFLQASLEADSSEQSVERIFTFGFFGALAAALISFFAVPSSGYDAAIASYAAVCCVCAPFTATLAVNFPLRRACRSLRAKGAAAVSWRAAEQLGETGCVVLRDEELFPADAVVLCGIKTLGSGRVDDAILDAAALLKEAGGPLRTVFQRVIRGKNGILPRAEQVTAEEDGFTGWVQGRRVFVGSSELMKAHGIIPPSRDYEEKNCPPGTVPVYLARGGELCALFTVEYNADPALYSAMQRLVRSGCDIAVLTTDSNLSSAMIAEKFSVPEDVVTMVPDTQRLAKQEVQQEDIEQAVVTVRSDGAPVLEAASVCIHAKASFQLAVLLQMVGILLGLVLVFVFCAAGSISQIGVTEMLAFQTFWMLTSLVIPSIKRF